MVDHEFVVGEEYVRMSHDPLYKHYGWIVVTFINGSLAVSTAFASEREANEYYEFWVAQLAANTILK